MLRLLSLAALLVASVCGLPKPEPNALQLQDATHVHGATLLMDALLKEEAAKKPAETKGNTTNNKFETAKLKHDEEQRKLFPPPPSEMNITNDNFTSSDDPSANRTDYWQDALFDMYAEVGTDFVGSNGNATLEGTLCKMAETEPLGGPANLGYKLDEIYGEKAENECQQRCAARKGCSYVWYRPDIGMCTAHVKCTLVFGECVDGGCRGRGRLGDRVWHLSAGGWIDRLSYP